MDAVDITVDKLRDILEKNPTILFYIFPNMLVWIEERQDGSQVFFNFFMDIKRSVSSENFPRRVFQTRCQTFRSAVFFVNFI
ncbi:hypothetical protein [Neisseria elongata]|uniref:hypothetical protein n=1 Tax=Neisseria elongata TaxID=495 RepID=UPI00131CE0DA|nr:hypothetical protein [Neisseria elongata]